MPKFSKPKDSIVEIEGITVLVRSLTAGELSRVLHSVEVERGNGTPWRADYLLVLLTCLDLDRSPLFGDLAAVEAESPAVVAQLIQACVGQNKLGETVEVKKNACEVVPQG